MKLHTGKIDYVTHNFDLQRKTESGNDAIIAILSSYTFFVTNTKSGLFAHNNYNFGNFLWGAGAKALGFSEVVARFGENYNYFFNDTISKGKLDS